MTRSRLGFAARTLAAAAVLLALMPAITAAIYVSPTTVFMDTSNRDAMIRVGNNGDSPEEATIELRYGFPDADSMGTPYVRFIEDPPPEFQSANDWIRPFPPRVRLEPGTEQIVRLLARPPADLPDGEYWTRMIVTGRGARLRLPTSDSLVRVGVSLEVRLVTSVSFRKGRVRTGLRLRALSAEVQSDSVMVWASLAREGNAGWLGTADLELVTPRGERVAQWSIPMAVYFPMQRRFAYPVEGIEPGDYFVRVRFRTERPDLPSERVLRAPDVRDSVALRVF